MQSGDFFLVIQWWSILFLISIFFFPFISLLFHSFIDKGYLYGKIIGLLILSFIIFTTATVKIIPLHTEFIIGQSICISFLFFLFFYTPSVRQHIVNKWKLFLLEELIFFITLSLWTHVKTFQPDIFGLEKFMDFGFINSVLNSTFLPAKDMWFTPYSINYYYFGHFFTAILIKLSFIPASSGYNLMIATIFAFCFSLTFSLGMNLCVNFFPSHKNKHMLGIFCGIISAILLTLGGNLHSLYSFFTPYQTENPVPFWQLPFSPDTFPNSYWYPNATRFIFNTIHEFPIYSFVVSDLHGHVLSIPIVLTLIGFLYSLFLKKAYDKRDIFLLGFFLACAYMTNAWDGIIYFLLSILVFFYLSLLCYPTHTTYSKNKRGKFLSYAIQYSLWDKKLLFFPFPFLISVGSIITVFLLFSLPFSLFFKPFVSGIGILCSFDFLTKIGKIGPFLFEANHCQHSPWWQLIILYGFFYFWIIPYLILLFKSFAKKNTDYPSTALFILFLIVLGTLLIIIPEFIYMKDIYPAHYRANTMFKLVYQSFIMLSLVNGILITYYIIAKIPSSLFGKIGSILYKGIGISGIIAILVYPYFAINSYFGELRTYKGLNGLSYMKNSYPHDLSLILWIQKYISGQPIILEAQGDSYTNYARISANTGLPTILGWTVHEWLWRGTYDIPAPRITDVKLLYESKDIVHTKKLLKKYAVSYVVIGELEREKYPEIDIEKFKTLGKIVFEENNTLLIKLQY